MERINIKSLLDKYKSGTVSEEEKAFLENWYAQYKDAEGAEYLLEDRLEDANNIWTQLPIHKHEVQRMKIWPKVVAIAAAIVFLIIGVYFFNYRNTTSQSIQGLSAKNDVAPGTNKAILTLASGKTINLSDASNGKLAQEAGIIITKAKDGQLVYTINNVPVKDGSQNNKHSVLNTITIPRGGQYQLNLPDGTRVWLNATSSLRYPTAFTGKERRVELTGEAYFEVAKNKKQPFFVKTDKQEVEVLGTHFNVNSYADELSTKTTLLEGSVRVVVLSLSKHALRQAQGDIGQVQHDIGQAQHDDGTILKPGQQSTLLGNNISIENVDTNDAVAWKEGYFMFNNESLESVMRKISRWYNVNIEFTNSNLAKKTIYGTISRYSNVSKILNMLELTGKVKFEMENNTIKVSE